MARLEAALRGESAEEDDVEREMEERRRRRQEILAKYEQQDKHTGSESLPWF